MCSACSGDYENPDMTAEIAEERPQSYVDLLAEINAFKPVVTPCEGSKHDWLHFPEQIRDGITGMLGIRCGCGRIFEAWSHEAPTNQPAPELWASFQKFKQHIVAL